MRQGDAEAGQRRALFVGGEDVHLVPGEEQPALLVILAGKPGGIEADQVHRKGERQSGGGSAIAQQTMWALLGQKRRPAQVLGDPAPIRLRAEEQVLPPRGPHVPWRIQAGHPLREGVGIVAGEADHLIPGALGLRTLLIFAPDVVVAGHEEKAVARDANGGEEGIQAGGGAGVLLGQAPVGGVAGEADQIHRGGRAHLPQDVEEVALFQNPVATGSHHPDLAFAGVRRLGGDDALVQIRDVQDAKPAGGHRSASDGGRARVLDGPAGGQRRAVGIRFPTGRRSPFRARFGPCRRGRRQRCRDRPPWRPVTAAQGALQPRTRPPCGTGSVRRPIPTTPCALAAGPDDRRRCRHRRSAGRDPRCGGECWTTSARAGASRSNTATRHDANRAFVCVFARPLRLCAKSGTFAPLRDLCAFA